jgi:ribosomal protein S3AE
MTSASHLDELDELVRRIVEVLLQDRTLIDNKSQLREILKIPYAENQCRIDQSTNRDLFTNMIHSWMSRSNGSTKDLCDILIANGYKMTAGKVIFCCKTLIIFISTNSIRFMLMHCLETESYIKRDHFRRSEVSETWRMSDNAQ